MRHLHMSQRRAVVGCLVLMVGCGIQHGVRPDKKPSAQATITWIQTPPYEPPRTDEPKQVPVPTLPPLPGEVDVQGWVYTHGTSQLPSTTTEALGSRMRQARVIPKAALVDVAFQQGDGFLVLYSRTTKAWGHRLYAARGTLTLAGAWKQQWVFAFPQRGINHVMPGGLDDTRLDVGFAAALGDLNQDGVPELVVEHGWRSAERCVTGSDDANYLTILDPRTGQQVVHLEIEDQPGGSSPYQSVRFQRLTPQRWRVVDVENQTRDCHAADIYGCYIRLTGGETVYLWPQRGPWRVMERRSVFTPVFATKWERKDIQTRENPTWDPNQTALADQVPPEVSLWRVLSEWVAAPSEGGTAQTQPTDEDADHGEGEHHHDQEQSSDDTAEKGKSDAPRQVHVDRQVVGFSDKKWLWVADIQNGKIKPQTQTWLAAVKGWNFVEAKAMRQGLFAGLTDRNKDGQAELWIQVPLREEKSGAVWWWWYLVDGKTHRVLWQHAMRVVGKGELEEEAEGKSAKSEVHGCGWTLVARQRGSGDPDVIEVKWSCEDKRPSEYYQVVKGRAFWRAIAKARAEGFWRTPYTEKKKKSMQNSEPGCQED